MNHSGMTFASPSDVTELSGEDYAECDDVTCVLTTPEPLDLSVCERLAPPPVPPWLQDTDDDPLSIYGIMSLMFVHCSVKPQTFEEILFYVSTLPFVQKEIRVKLKIYKELFKKPKNCLQSVASTEGRPAAKLVFPQKTKLSQLL